MNEIDRIAARPAAYIRETGLPQLTGGLIFFLLGASALLQPLLPKTFVAQEAPKWVAIALAAAAFWASRTIQQRAVFPRGGYVELPTSQVRWPAFALGLLIPILMVFFRAHLHEKTIAPGFAVALAAASLWTARQIGSTPLRWFALYFLCLAPVLWFIPEQRASWLEALAGAPLAIFGAFQLRSFLRTNPLSAGYGQ